MQDVLLPKTAGSRSLAEDLTSGLPPRLGDSRVVINAENMKATAQSFADELVKQILVVRDAASLDVRCATPRFAALLHRSAETRAVQSRLFVDVRPL